MTKTESQISLYIRNPHVIFLLLGVTLFGITLLRNLWIGDDAFITLRVVDNWVNGYGLRWNVSERVQAYTHPLWLFLVTLFYWVKPNPYFAFYGLSFIVSMITVILLLHWFSPNFQSTLLGSWLLISSIAFLDYSSSGLENPLSHLLLLIYLYLGLNRSAEPRLGRLFWMSLLAGLATLNRLDTLLFYLPLLLYEWQRLRAHWLKASLIVLAGLLPIICWELFSLAYYGFLFPNTYPAKLNTIVPTVVFIERGVYYVLNSLNWDPVTLIVFAVATFVTLFKGDYSKKLALLGGLSYFLYVIWIGGDFMLGRFFSTLFLLSIILVFKSDLYQHLNLHDSFSFGLIVLLVFMLGAASSAHPLTIQPDSRLDIAEHGITNEKLFYYFQSGWLNQAGRFTPPFGGAAGLQARQAGQSPIFDSPIGAFGYYAGPEIFIIDSAALTDPLLARIPYLQFERPGHYLRALPEGYVETFEDGFQNKIRNPNLREYYDKLTIITHGELFTSERWRLIWEFNTGQYDYLVNNYLANTH